MESFSQIGQDLLVLKYLKEKRNGTFVDIGCGYPTYINNTYLLETKYDWSGISLDLNNRKDPDGGTWQEKRPNSKRVIANALTTDYVNLFSENNLPEVIDFLSLDLEPPSITTECLFKLPLDRYRFNFIAFETDEYREGGEERRDITREYLTSLGYVLVESKRKQDDFYLHSSLI